MGKAEQFEFETHNPLEVAHILSDIIHISGDIITQRMREGFNVQPLRDELGLLSAFSDAKLKLLFDPVHLSRQQLQWWLDVTKIWQSTAMSMMGLNHNPVIEPSRNDYRFKDEAWNGNPLFSLIKQAYLLTARFLYDTLTGVSGVDKHHADKVDFFTRQFIDALAPTNFLLTNPEVQREFIRSGGVSVLKGLRNLMADLAHGQGTLKIRMTDLDAFEMGKNIALTPGKVVMQTPMMQLIQYEPTTKKVKQRPLLIVPPWINKYYILDLREKNSFIKWAVDQGHTVFIISWINPDASYADKGFDAYLTEGTLAAVDAVETATDCQEINTIGYCLGGTLLATTMAYMAAKRDQRIKSATFFASMLDFSCPGELGVFIDEEQLENLETRMERGFLDGGEMATTFNMLRANDLIWSFFVNNYLLGKEPFPFDLLYWNSDSTRMPAAMHRFYLHNMYLHNRLSVPGGISLNGVPIDLGKVKIPTYFLSTYEDHIAPWKSTYAGTQLLQGKNRFVLGGSGHIAGVINPPRADKPKYYYWTNDALVENPDTWFAKAERHEGSWWPDWEQWISQLDNIQVAARIPGDGELDVIEDAPGRYVKGRID